MHVQMSTMTPSHVASLCAFECYHCTCPSLFLIPMVASFMAVLTDAFLLVYHHDTLLLSDSSILRNLMGSSWEVGWPSSPHHWSKSSNLYSFKYFHYLSIDMYRCPVEL